MRRQGGSTRRLIAAEELQAAGAGYRAMRSRRARGSDWLRPAVPLTFTHVEGGGSGELGLFLEVVWRGKVDDEFLPHDLHIAGRGDAELHSVTFHAEYLDPDVALNPDTLLRFSNQNEHPAWPVPSTPPWAR